MHTCTARGHLSITSHGKTDRSPCQDGSSARENLNLIVMVLRFAGLFLALLPALVIPILPSFPKMLKNSTANTCWLLTATLLAAAVSTPVSGRLGDMYGKPRMLLVRMILLVTGSIVCVTSDKRFASSDEPRSCPLGNGLRSSTARNQYPGTPFLAVGLVPRSGS